MHPSTSQVSLQHPLQEVAMNAIAAGNVWSKRNIMNTGDPSGDGGVGTAVRFLTPSSGKTETSAPNPP